MTPTYMESTPNSESPTPIAVWEHPGVHWKLGEHYGEALPMLALFLHPSQPLSHQN